MAAEFKGLLEFLSSRLQVDPSAVNDPTTAGRLGPLEAPSGCDA